MKQILIAILVAVNSMAFAAESGANSATGSENSSTIQSGEAAYIDGESIAIADETGLVEENQCGANERPVVVCRKVRNGRRHGCGPNSRLCRSSFPGRSRCVPRSQPCGK